MHSALGRSDIEVDAQDRHWVFEIKFAKTQSEIPTLLYEGITQIRDRRYGKSTHAPVSNALFWSSTNPQDNLPHGKTP